MLKQYIKPETKYFRLQVQPMMLGSVVTPGNDYVEGPDLAPRTHNIFAGDDEEDDDDEEEW